MMMPLWSSWYFFSLYANAAGYDATWSTGSQDVLDRYLLAKLHDVVEQTQASMDVYDIAGACELLANFLDVLTNWYIRRSRERFWNADGVTDGSTADTGAFDTLYTALEVLTRLCAPLLPFTTEQVWRGLTGGRSVHLADWPDPSDLPADDALVAAMDRARTVCSTASSLRKANKLRVRLPLADLTVVTADPGALAPFAEVIADEVNVKQVTVLGLAEAGQEDFGLQQKLTVNARAAGPRLGRTCNWRSRAASPVTGRSTPRASSPVVGWRCRRANTPWKRWCPMPPGPVLFRRCSPAADSSCWTPSSPTNCAPRVLPATWCGPCSRSDGHVGLMSATGSAWP